MTRHAWFSIGLACALGAVAGCGSKPAPLAPVVLPPAKKIDVTLAKLAVVTPPPAPSPKLLLQPLQASLLAGDPGLQMVVDILSPSGGLKDGSAGVKWQAEPAGVVEVDPSGYVRAIAPGRARVRALYTSQAGQDPIVSEAEVTVGDSPRLWDFGQDVAPILTRAGCNTGGCHGRGDGQNGFHLSLFGYDPEGDHRALTRDLGERRLSPIRPESSLFLAKATGTIPHVGGPRIRIGSEEYNTILAWMKAGTPLTTPKNHGKMTRLSVQPGDVRLDEPGDQQLRVLAHFEDGHDRDVTRLATYKVNDDSAIAIDPRGLAKLLRRAEADLVVRYGSQVVSTRLATIINPGLKFDFAQRARHNFIDDQLFKRLESLKVPPSPAAGDAVFLRRVALDLSGEQPPTDRVREYLKDTDPEKRAKLIDSLIASRDFTRFWQIKLGDLLEITTARPDLGNIAAINYQSWLAKRLIANAPWDVMVRELLTSLGDPNDRESGGPVAYALEGLDPKVSAEKTAQRFLGLRIRCAQCHDHPFDVWTQDDYYGLAATFAKVQRTGGGPGGMMANKLAVKVVPTGMIEHPRTHKAAEAKLLAGSIIKVAETEDPRVKLAEWMTSADNPYFARAMANWVWAQFFGKGIADPPDDLSRSNPPVHPELLDALAKDFIAHKYDLRALIRTVATSEAYAMASTTVPGNEQDNRLFSHQMPRPLTAHQMADALAQATDVPNQFDGQQNKGKRAIEIQDPATRSTILETFGRCARVNGCASVANPSLSLRQSLLVIGGSVVEEKVSAPRGYLANLMELGLAPDEIVENLYLKTICRPPTSEEAAHWAAELAQAKNLREAAEDLFWALLNSREFAFNH